MSKIPGKESPADLMTKILGSGEISERLSKMGMSGLRLNRLWRDLKAHCEWASKAHRGWAT